MPRPGTPVIPPGWSAHIRPTVTATQTATCDLRRPGGTGKTFNGTTGTMTDTPNTPYLTGAACRVAALSPAGAVRLFGEQQTTTIPYLVTVDFGAAGDAVVNVDDLVEVTAADDNADPTLPGRTLRVAGVARSALSWERVLGCIDNEG